MTKTADLTRFIPTMFGFAAFQHLRAACELQLFEFLGQHGPAMAEDVVEGLHLPGRSARTLLLGTTALGLTVVDDGVYRLDDHIRQAMDDGTWPLIRDIVEYQHRLTYLPAGEFAESLRSGRNAGLKHLPGTGGDLYTRLEQNPELENLFFRGMTAWSELSNPVLLDRVDYSDVDRILDVGGGSAVNAIALAKAHPHLHITVFDLEGAVDVARSAIETNGLSERISVVVGDMFTDPFPEGHDLILFAHQLVIWSPEKNRELLCRAYDALPEGGRVVVFNAFSDDGGIGPLYTALDSVYFMTLPADASTLYEWHEHEEWLADAGFGDVTRILPVGWTPHGVVEGRRIHGSGDLS